MDDVLLGHLVAFLEGMVVAEAMGAGKCLTKVGRLRPTETLLGPQLLGDGLDDRIVAGSKVGRSASAGGVKGSPGGGAAGFAGLKDVALVGGAGGEEVGGCLLDVLDVAGELELALAKENASDPGLENIGVGSFLEAFEEQASASNRAEFATLGEADLAVQLLLALEVGTDGFEAKLESREAVLEVSDEFGAETAVETGLDTELEHFESVSFLDEGTAVNVADSVFKKSTSRALVAVTGMLRSGCGKNG
jgi:hypothetical protein